MVTAEDSVYLKGKVTQGRREGVEERTYVRERERGLIELPSPDSAYKGHQWLGID